MFDYFWLIAGVSASTLEDLKQGRYSKVFTKAKVVEEIRAEESG